MKKLISLILVVALLLSLSACGGITNNLSQNKKASATQIKYNFLSDDIAVPEGYNDYTNSATDFSMNLFKSVYKKSTGSSVISPASVLFSLSMCSNGAQNETQKEFLQTMFSGMSADSVNKCSSYLLQRLKFFSDEESKLSVANSIWLNKGLKVNSSFLDKNADYYNADVFETDFSNEKALSDINSYVKDNTDGMVEKMLDNISPDAMMILINAIVLEDLWATIYEDSDISSDTFHGTNADTDAEFMHSKESLIKTKNSVGFVKNYKTLPIKFVAVMPDKDVDFSSFTDSLSNEYWQELLNSLDITKSCNAYLPKFKVEFGTNLKEDLKSLGIIDAFSDSADFSKISTDAGLKIEDIIHKSYIEVDNGGTKAAASTAVMMNKTALIDDDEENIETVRLDRPFIFSVIDNESNLPLFLGCVTDID